MLKRLLPIGRTLAAVALVLSCSSASLAMEPSAKTGPTPSAVTTVGTMRVEAYGSGSPALIFIPGLACGSWVWDGAVRTYAKTHAVYVVTLAGFDGVPAAPGPALDNADASLLEFITKRKLDRPFVIGHSMGGFLALRFGTEHSDLVRGIVSVDGTPVFPALAQATPEQRLAAGSKFAATMSAMTAEGFAAAQRTTIPSMVSDPARAAQVAALTAKSDPVATGAYARDLLTADLRPQLKLLSAPTLEIAPVPSKPAAFEGPQAASASKSERADGYRDFYASLLAGAPNLRVVPISDSLHFVMIDQPQALYEEISRFIAAVSA